MEDGKIEMAYCGKFYKRVALTYDAYCTANDGACPSCLRAHIANLEAELAALRGQVGGVVPELTEALLDEIAGPWLPDRDPMCTRRAERRVGVRDAWAKIRSLGVEVQRPGWSILSEETHELRSYTWRDDHDRLIEGWGLYAIGASEGSVPFQRYRARPSSRVAGEGTA